MTIIEKIVAVLRDAPRLGAEKDEPEGMRYIQISDTLATMLLDNLTRGLTTDDIRLWVVGKMVKYPEWELQGVFTSEALAIDACVGKDDELGWFIGPVRLNERISDTPKEWPGAYYPFPGVIRLEPK